MRRAGRARGGAVQTAGRRRAAVRPAAADRPSARPSARRRTTAFSLALCGGRALVVARGNAALGVAQEGRVQVVELVGARDGVELYYVLTYLPDLQVRSEAFRRLQPCDRLQTAAGAERARPANAKAADNRAAGGSWSGAARSSARLLALGSRGRTERAAAVVPPEPDAAQRHVRRRQGPPREPHAVRCGFSIREGWARRPHRRRGS